MGGGLADEPIGNIDKELREVSLGHSICKTGKDRTLSSEHGCSSHGLKCRNMWKYCQGGGSAAAFADEVNFTFYSGGECNFLSYDQKNR